MKRNYQVLKTLQVYNYVQANLYANTCALGTHVPAEECCSNKHCMSRCVPYNSLYTCSTYLLEDMHACSAEAHYKVNGFDWRIRRLICTRKHMRPIKFKNKHCFGKTGQSGSLSDSRKASEEVLKDLFFIESLEHFSTQDGCCTYYCWRTVKPLFYQLHKVETVINSMNPIHIIKKTQQYHCYVV